jgi:hypothetical protein
MASVAELRRAPAEQRIEVEKGIPLPVAGPGRAKYPWHDMEVGDSFFVPGANATRLNSASTSYVHNSPDGKGKKFRARILDGGARIWRIA